MVSLLNFFNGHLFNIWWVFFFNAGGHTGTLSHKIEWATRLSTPEGSEGAPV